MTSDERKKHIKHALIDKGISFRAWCILMGVSHSVARDLVYGRLTGSKSERTRIVRDALVKDFGCCIFD